MSEGVKNARNASLVARSPKWWERKRGVNKAVEMGGLDTCSIMSFVRMGNFTQSGVFPAALIHTGRCHTHDAFFARPSFLQVKPEKPTSPVVESKGRK